MVSVVPRILRFVTTALGEPLDVGTVKVALFKVRLSRGTVVVPIVLVKAVMFKRPLEMLMFPVPRVLAFRIFPEQITIALLLVNPPVADPEVAD